MKALNTSILLEYLIEGDENAQHAASFFESADHSEIYFLNNIVLHEVATFLEENVKFDKTDILTALHALLSNSQIRFENRKVIMSVLELYKKSRLRFSECLKEVINQKYQTGSEKERLSVAM